MALADPISLPDQGNDQGKSAPRVVNPEERVRRVLSTGQPSPKSSVGQAGDETDIKKKQGRLARFCGGGKSKVMSEQEEEVARYEDAVRMSNTQHMLCDMP